MVCPRLKLSFKVMFCTEKCRYASSLYIYIYIYIYIYNLRDTVVQPVFFCSLVSIGGSITIQMVSGYVVKLFGINVNNCLDARAVVVLWLFRTGVGPNLRKRYLCKSIQRWWFIRFDVLEFVHIICDNSKHFTKFKREGTRRVSKI